MSNCNFVCSFPEYVLDRTIIISDGHEHKVSGYKLAKSSEYFKAKLKEIRSKEIEKFKTTKEIEDSVIKTERESISSNSRRKRTKSVNELDIEIINASYKDTFGLEYVLSFIHSQDNLGLPELSLNNTNFLSIIKAGSFLKVPLLIEHCLNHIKTKLDSSNCWEYFSMGSEILNVNKEIYEIIESYISQYFTSATNDEKMLQIPFNQLKSFLKNDQLNCKDEVLLLPIIDRWIEYDKTNRIIYFSKLLECIRLGRLNLKELEDISSSNLVQQNFNECENLLTWSKLTSEEISSPGNSISKENMETINYMHRPRLPREAIVVVGGWEGNQDDPNFGPSRAIQIYNNRANTWKRLVNETFALDEGHAYSGCVIMNLRLYVIGGYVASGPTQTLKVFDFFLKRWKYLSPMHEKRNYISASNLNGFIYAIGGHNGRMRLNSVEKYDPIHNNWIFITPMKQVRSDAGSDSLNDKLYVCGGFDGHHFYASVEAYDSESNQWTTVAPMNNIRSGVSMVAYGNHLYAIGGNDGLQRLRTVERFDPDSNRWQAMPSMIRQRSNFCVSVLENEIYVMGGWSDETNSTIALVEKWLPGLGNDWKHVQQLFMPASANCCCSISNVSSIQEFFN